MITGSGRKENNLNFTFYVMKDTNDMSSEFFRFNYKIIKYNFFENYKNILKLE